MFNETSGKVEEHEKRSGEKAENGGGWREEMGSRWDEHLGLLRTSICI